MNMSERYCYIDIDMFLLDDICPLSGGPTRNAKIPINSKPCDET